MKIKYYFLLMGIVLAACSGASQTTPTPLPEPTDPPRPTATATEIPATETALPPQPTATNTPQATPTEIPTETALPLQINFTPYENNPVVKTGGVGEWDYFNVFGGRVVLLDGTFHLFYGGRGDGISGIGYAASSDGLAFTKHDANPIFQPDGEGFDALAVRLPTPLVVGDTWMLYYNASSTSESSYYDVVGSSIGLTTAPEPTGPWTEGQLVLKTGGSGEWDEGFVVPNSVLATDEGYRLYYTGGINPERMYNRNEDNEGSGAMCGMATSADGINWTKYDDPSTTEAPYAESDPVMGPSPSGWDSVDVKCSVMKTDAGWEMLYKGLGVISYNELSEYGYATSSDGVNWIKYLGNPVFRNDRDPLSKAGGMGGNIGGDVDSATAPSALKDGSTYYLYYSYWLKKLESVVTGTITEP